MQDRALPDELSSFPPEWKTEKLASTAQGFIDGDWIEAPYITDEGIRLVQTGNIGLGQFIDRSEYRKFISDRSFKELGCKWVYPGDILICRLADPIGRACIVPSEVGDCITAVDCTIYRPKPDSIDTHFAVHLFNSDLHLRRIADVAGGSTRQRISRSNLGNTLLLLPPLNEQRRIAEMLDTVDAAIQQTEALIAKLKLMKAGLLHDLLTRGLDEHGQLRDPNAHPEQFKDSPLGQIPGEWEIKTLSQIAETYAGGTPPRSIAGMFGGQIPWVKSAELNRIEITGTEESLSQTGYQSSSVKWVPENTPLVAMYGATAGVVSWLKIRAVTNQAVLAVTPQTERTDARWLYWVLFFSSGKLVASVQGSGQPNLSKSLIDALRITQPASLEEQRAIAAILDAHDARIRAEEAYCDKLKQLKKGLMRDLLTGRVRVQATEAAR